jgi:hypothetical protein
MDHFSLEHSPLPDEIISNNFRSAMLSYSYLITDISFGSHLYEQRSDGCYREVINRAYTIGFMPKALAEQFIPYISTTGEKVAEKINILRSELYETISPSLIPKITTSFHRVAPQFEDLARTPYRAHEFIETLESETSFMTALSRFGITEGIEDIVGVVIIDPKAGRLANGQDGLFASIHTAFLNVAPAADAPAAAASAAVQQPTGNG